MATPTPAQAMFALQVMYMSGLLTSGAYGLYILVATSSFYILVRHGQRYQGRHVLLGYTAYMFVVVTIWHASAAVMWSFPLIGVPQMADSCAPAFVVTKICAALQVLGGDAMLLYRATTVWNRDKRVVIPLTVMYLTSVGVSIPSNTACDDATSIWNLILLFLFLAYNTLVPILIAIKLWRMRRALASSRAANGDVGKKIASTLAVMGTTVAFFLIIGLLLVPVLLKNPVMQPLLGTVLQDIIILLPALIIFWVSVGVYRTSAVSAAASRHSQSTNTTLQSSSNADTLRASFPADEKVLNKIDDV